MLEKKQFPFSLEMRLEKWFIVSMEQSTDNL